MGDALPIPTDPDPSGRHSPDDFASVYLAHYRAIAGAIYRRTGDPHLTEDLTSETFLAAFRALDRFRPGKVPIRVWLLRIASNKVNRWARRQAGLTSRLLELARIRPAQATPTLPSYSGALGALLSLPLHYQTVLSLHHLENLSLDEVALVLDCSVATVKSRLTRARAALRRRVREQGDRQ